MESQINCSLLKKINPHISSLYNLAFCMVNSEGSASDYVVHTISELLKSAQKDNFDQTEKIWMFKKLIHTVCSKCNQNIKNRPCIDDESLEEFFIYNRLDEISVVQNISKNDFIENSINADLIKSAMGKLHCHFRILILLYDVEGFSYDEIETITDIPISNISLSLHIARKLIQRELWKCVNHKTMVQMQGYLVYQDFIQ